MRGVVRHVLRRKETTKMATTDDATAIGFFAFLIGAVALAIALMAVFVIGCEVQPDIAELQEALCERLSESAASYRDCLDEVR